MKTKLIILKNYLLSSFWFFPTLLIIGAIILSQITLFIDTKIQIAEDAPYLSFLQGSIEGYRAMLSTISSSMMSIVSIVFSMTLVALTLASGQYGSRVLKNYMSNRLNQLVLGSYIAVFVYCLLILRVVKTEEFIDYSADISVFVALILALVNIYLLIIYIHHIATSIQAETLIQNIYEDASKIIQKQESQLSENTSQKNISKNGKEVQKEIRSYTNVSEIPSSKNGYIEYVDSEGLLKLAEKKDVFISLKYKVGDYILKESPFIEVRSKNIHPADIAEKIDSFIAIGNRKSGSQDLRYSLGQLVEIAVRALSPGINDPVTAMLSLNRIASAVGGLLGQEEKSSLYYDSSDIARLIIPKITFQEIIHLSFSEIHYYAKNNPEVLAHITKLLNQILKLPMNQKQKSFLSDFQKQMHQDSSKNIQNPVLLKTLEEVH